VFNPFVWYANLINEGKIKAWYFIFVLYGLQIVSNFFLAILIVLVTPYFFESAPSQGELIEFLAPYFLILTPINIVTSYVTGFLFSFWKTFIGKAAFVFFLFLIAVGFLYATQQVSELTELQPSPFAILGFVILLMGYWRIFLKMPAENKLPTQPIK